MIRIISPLLIAINLVGCALWGGAKDTSHLLTTQQRFLKASAQGDLTEVKRSLSGDAEIDRPGAGGTTALMVASYRGHIKVVEYLLEKNALLELRDDIGQTALHHAVIGSRAAVVTELLAAGAEPEPVSALGLTPLMLASRLADIETVTRLLAAGARPELTEPTGWNALFFAVSRGDLGIYRRLMQENPINLKHQDTDGNSLLHIAALYRQEQIFNDLIKRGVPVDLKNKEGLTAQQVAKNLKEKSNSS